MIYKDFFETKQNPGTAYVNQFYFLSFSKLRNLRRSNQALLGKWLWRYGTKSEHLQRRIIKAKYGNELGVCSHSIDGPYSVNLWKFIRRSWLIFSRFLQFDVGDGIKVKFWHNVWCGDCPLKLAFPELFSISHHKETLIDNVLHFSNGCHIGMFDSLDWSKIESWSLWLLLWILFIPSLFEGRGWIDPIGDLPRIGVLRFVVITT